MASAHAELAALRMGGAHTLLVHQSAGLSRGLRHTQHAGACRNTSGGHACQDGGLQLHHPKRGSSRQCVWLQASVP